MAIVISGASQDLLTVDPSNSIRSILYMPDGGVVPPPQMEGAACAAVLVRQTAATGAGAAVWALRNSQPDRSIYVTRAALSLSFDGTGAATLMRYELIKGRGATVLTGGAAVVPLRKKTSQDIPMAEIRVLPTGLTLTGVSYGGALAHMNHPRLTISATQAEAAGPQYAFEFLPPVEVNFQEVFAIRNGPNNASVIGDTLMGLVEFVEGRYAWTI